ncbi:MAG TPA: hypothetical protein VK469_18030, partial [Candidatus Kapabacteria bacterium]|nr:hypothetical protein [Candidatus Kapabacteria bacterium]
MEGTINHIFETLNLQGFLLNTINYGVKKLGCAGGSVFLFEGATGKLELYAHTYTYPEKLYSIIKPGKGIIGEAFIKNERVIIDKSSIDEDSVLYKMPKNESRKAIVAIPSSSEALFCFDFVDKNGKMSGLLSKEIEAVENLNKEINSQAFVKKLLNTRFQQALLDLHTAGEGPGNLRQAVNDFLTELPSICTRAGKPKPNLAYIQLVDRRRGVIRTIQGFGLPLSFQSSISHSLEDKDIQSYTVQSQNFHLIVGNDERLHQEIYEKYHHSNLVRLWLPLFPVPQSWLMEKPGQSLDLMLMNQLGWEDKDYKDKEGTVIGKKRIGQWKHGCQLPSRLVYGTLEIGFQRTKEEFSFEPFTSELIHWYIAQAYKMSENLYRATLDGSLESIGHITASASGANKTNFSVTMSEWGNLEERVYPITTDFCAAEPEKIPISQPAMKTPAKIQFYNDENIEEHASKMQKILKEIAEKAAHLALRLDDYASDPYLLMEEVEDHSNLGTLYPDKGIKPVLQEMSRGVGATHCILYLFEEETTSNSNSSAKSEINMNFLGVLGEWPEDKVGAQFAIPKKESLEKEEIINLASGVAKKKKSSKAMPFENTKQLAALLPLELSDKTTAVLVFIFPGNVSKNDIKLGVFESRIARWIHRLSLRRMVQADQFSLAMHKLRKSIGYAREGASHEKETRHIEAYGKKIMQDFLEQFAALGILFSIYSKSVTGPSLVERFWCCRPFNKKSFAGCDIFLGTPASSPGLTALKKSDLVIYSPMDEKRFLETNDLNMELLTKVNQYREHNKTEQADSLKRIVDLIEEPRSTMLVIPVSSFSKSGGNINGAIAIFLMGEH